MQTKRDNFIEDFTASLLQEHGIWDRLPINICKLSRCLGFIRVEENFGDNFSGAAISDGLKKIITINKAHPIRRKRFTHAHEICHLLWHSEKSVNVDVTINYRDARSSTGDDWREVEANKFAACLLMPKSLLEKEIKAITPQENIGDEEISILAKTFKVSTQAMCIRLTSLGYW